MLRTKQPSTQLQPEFQLADPGIDPGINHYIGWVEEEKMGGWKLKWGNFSTTMVMMEKWKCGSRVSNLRSSVLLLRVLSFDLNTMPNEIILVHILLHHGYMAPLTTSHMSTIGHHSTTVESEKYLHFDMEYLQWTILDLGLSEGPHRALDTPIPYYHCCVYFLACIGFMFDDLYIREIMENISSSHSNSLDKFLPIGTSPVTGVADWALFISGRAEDYGPIDLTEFGLTQLLQSTLSFP
ncbi:hypothetical protein LguiB_026016 [Lonicera macranthoides]